MGICDFARHYQSSQLPAKSLLQMVCYGSSVTLQSELDFFNVYFIILISSGSVKQSVLLGVMQLIYAENVESFQSVLIYQR